MRLYLIRHPRPEIEAGICYGSTDLCVSPEEEERALAILVPALPSRVPLFSSPLRRCAGLAHRLAQVLDAGEPILDRRLVEMDFGAWEGRMWDDIPRREVDAWAGDPTGYRPGGGETVLEAAARVHAFLEVLRQRRPASAVVVCHAGTMRLMQACRAGISPDQAAVAATRAAQAPRYGELVVLEL